jgi:hypothetical protein
MHLGREMAAELVGKPERSDWKACTAGSAEEEAASTEVFKAQFKPYDAVMQE